MSRNVYFDLNGYEICPCKVEGCEESNSSASACSISWSKEPPTEPGWYWYKDYDYGPAPVYITWSGFINRPEARNLDVDLAVGEYQELPGCEVKDLTGEWYPLQAPPEK